MANADDVLALEASCLGIAEGADGGTVFHDWYGAPHAWAWCSIFQSFCLITSGVPLGPGARGGAWVSGVRDWLARDDTPGQVLQGTEHAAPGDLVFFEWGSTPGGYDHIGMIEHVDGDWLICIEGNTSNRVMRHRRPRWSGIPELGRPAYTTVTPPGEDDDDMKARQIMVRDLRPGRDSASYATTVFDNADGTSQGSGVGTLLPDASAVTLLAKLGASIHDVHNDDEANFLLGALGVLPDAKTVNYRALP